MSATQALRLATRDAHDAVDAVYGGYDLARADDYARFLTAHARILPLVEGALAAHPALPRFEPRALALAADLAALGRPMPPALPVAIDGATIDDDDPAAAWGMFYVVEGSRLGGVMLARTVDPALPRAYLSAAHPAGGWRAIRSAIDAADSGGDWTARAVAAARRCFDWYRAAARP